ncbi:hypothetical protein L209DRAFT_488304 [Thermothelomyces heterothallicus CBS 203.75]
MSTCTRSELLGDGLTARNAAQGLMCPQKGPSAGIASHQRATGSCLETTVSTLLRITRMRNETSQFPSPRGPAHLTRWCWRCGVAAGHGRQKASICGPITEAVLPAWNPQSAPSVDLSGWTASVKWGGARPEEKSSVAMIPRKWPQAFRACGVVYGLIMSRAA